MNDTLIDPAAMAVRDAIAVIDDGLRTLNEREVVSATEVSNLLLDLRLLLAAADAPVDPGAELEDSPLS